MSGQSQHISYDPLPLTGDDHPSNALYNAPPSPDPRLSSFHTPQMVPSELDLSERGMPLGAAQPRFMGHALYDGPGAPNNRDSFASSQHTLPAASEYTSSVYALNEGPGRFEGGYRDDPGDSYFSPEQGAMPLSSVGKSRMLEEKRAVYAHPRSKSRRKVIILAVIAGLILLILAVLIPIYFAVIKPHTSSGADSEGNSASAAQPSSTGKGSDPTKVAIVTGGDGSTVTMDDGSTFTYLNKFGGQWYWDKNDPFHNGAKAQSWSPALNETFHYGTDQIRGVNLGGWLVTEPFITPALYEAYNNNSNPPVDEWGLCQSMAADAANGGLGQLENHYKTFITEKDFAAIAAAGLNYVRIPLGYWAVETKPGEPFLPKTSWTYFLKAIQWARKYGIRINLDFHAIPGSQNGWNHSGRLGTVGFLNGPMGYANAQRALDTIRVIAEFISQSQYKDVVTMFGIANEPQGTVIGQDTLQRFYLEAYKIVRTASGTGEGNGPYVNIHDGFFPRSQWDNIFPNADRMTLDSHPYLCFADQSSADMSTHINTPCSAWGATVNASMSTFGLVNAGEFSNAVTDCGKWLNGVNLGTRYEGDYADGNNWPRQGSCDTWTDWPNYSDSMKQSIMSFALSSMDALQNYFFWTWKIGNSSVTGKVETPAWSYSLGLENGWMPKDPRSAAGTCGNNSPWNPPLKAWQTGGAGADQLPASVTVALAWPPPSISRAGDISLLPSYTPTGTIPTLAVPTFTVTSDKTTTTADAGSGWANTADTAGVAAEITTCSYLDPWVAPTIAPPSPLCGGPARRYISKPQITPHPA